MDFLVQGERYYNDSLIVYFSTAAAQMTAYPVPVCVVSSVYDVGMIA